MLLLASTHFLKIQCSVLYCRPTLPMVRFGSIPISCIDAGAGDDISENVKLLRPCSRSGKLKVRNGAFSVCEFNGTGLHVEKIRRRKHLDYVADYPTSCIVGTSC